MCVTHYLHYDSFLEELLRMFILSQNFILDIHSTQLLITVLYKYLLEFLSAIKCIMSTML